MTADPGATGAGGLDLRGRSLEAARVVLSAAFRAAGVDTPALDARLLIAAACGMSGGDVLTEGDRLLPADEAARLQAFAARRIAREPVARILGHRHFHGLRLEITPDTLDPRPETETLVDGVLELLRSGEAPGGGSPRLLDAGTGSGAILLALLHDLPHARGVGVDCSAAALAVAARNAHLTGVGSRAAFVVSDWLTAIEGEFDVIVANPPYIPAAVIAGLDPDVVRYDPHLALDGGPDGLDRYRLLIPQAMERLTRGGWLVLEIGHDQAADIGDIARKARATDIRVWLDLGGKPRCVAIRHH